MHCRNCGLALSAASASTVNPCAIERILRNIDAVDVPVIGAAILQMIDDLQRRAERVVGWPGRAALAMDIEHEAADRHRRIGAIVDQVVPVADNAAW